MVVPSLREAFRWVARVDRRDTSIFGFWIRLCERNGLILEIDRFGVVRASRIRTRRRRHLCLSRSLTSERCGYSDVLFLSLFLFLSLSRWRDAGCPVRTGAV